MKFSYLSLLMLLLAACAPFGDKKDKPTSEDLDEAAYMQELMSSQPDMRGNYAVVAGTDVTTVYVNNSDAPADEYALRDSLREIRSDMDQYFNRETNRLRFVFKSVTIEE